MATIPLAVSRSSLLGEDLRNETFESSPEHGSLGEDVLPVARNASSAHAVGAGESNFKLGSSGELVSTSINAVRSFEVFLGRRYDPAEAEVLGDPSAELHTQPVLRPSQHGASADVTAIAETLEKKLAVGGGGVGSKGRGSGAAAAALPAGSARSRPSLETPLQRYHRLANEVSALEEELKAVAASDAKRPAKATPVDPSRGVWRGLTEGVSGLSSRLEGLKEEAALATATGTGSGGDPTPAPPSASSSFSPLVESLKRMAEELERSLPPDINTARAGTSSSQAQAASSSSQHQLLVSLEGRLAALETTASISSSASSSSSSPPIAGRVVALESRVAALLQQQQQNDKGEETFKEKASAFVASEDRLNRAIAALERWDSTAASLPHIADRLATLRDAHREARLVPSRVSSLEEAIRGLAGSISEDTAILRELQQGMKDLAATVQQNLSLLGAAAQEGSKR